jgi:RNase adaptor protein for sRNA GlmZ degradation
VSALPSNTLFSQNPSRHARQTSTGPDPSLQKELMRRDSFNVRSRAEDYIQRLMEVKNVRAAKEGEVTVLTVGCLCGSGHHRSVAFAEQLEKVEGPEGWGIRVS